MHITKFTEEQLAFDLKQAEHGTAAKLIRKMRIMEETYYWSKKKWRVRGAPKGSRAQFESGTYLGVRSIV